jgi:hypothetical protein
MATIRTVEKLQQQLTGAEAASRKHKVENEALRTQNGDLATRNKALSGALAAFLRNALQNGYDETHQEVKDARAALAL